MVDIMRDAMAPCPHCGRFHREGQPAFDEDRVRHEGYARASSYFWLPCPVCLRFFGGHECAAGMLYLKDGIAMVTCNDPACVAFAERLSTNLELCEQYRRKSDHDARYSPRPYPGGEPDLGRGHDLRASRP